MLKIDINEDFFIIKKNKIWNFHNDEIDEYLNYFNDFIIYFNIKDYILTKYDYYTNFLTKFNIEFDNIKIIFFDKDYIEGKKKEDHQFLIINVLDGTISIKTNNKILHSEKNNLRVIFDIVNYYKKILKLDLLMIEDNSYFLIDNQKINSRLFRLLIEKRDLNDVSIYRKKYNFIYLNEINKSIIKHHKIFISYNDNQIINLLSNIFNFNLLSSIPNIINYFQLINEIYIYTSLLIHDETKYYEIIHKNLYEIKVDDYDNSIFFELKELIIKLIDSYHNINNNLIVINTEKIIDLLSMNKII